MALPRFFDRIADASLPLLGSPLRRDFRAALERSAVTLEAPEEPADAALRAGWMLTADLCARLYPAIHLVGRADLVTEAARRILDVNPACDVRDATRMALPALTWRRHANATTVFAGASGWNCVVDRAPEVRQAPTAPAALAAAAVGAGQLFRTVFAEMLGSSARRAPEPGGFNLISLKPWDEQPRPVSGLAVGEVHLVGCGAVGEATALTLVAASARGHILGVEDQPVELSNLQRYVLTIDASEGRHKLDVLEDALRGSAMSLTKIPARWGLDARAMAGSTDTVLVAVDTAEARIAIQAGLPPRAYNAFTGPLDLGWSRHERFGDEPCLACLYWPTGPSPERHDVVGADLGEHPLRVLMYLLSGTPVGSPLPLVQASPTLPPPRDAARWLRVSLLEDLKGRFHISDTIGWAALSLDQLYRDGICGGGIARREGAASGDMSVPLAHQSALAGIMLATQLLAASEPSLARLRPREVEARYNTLGRPSQQLPLPGGRAPGCICGDRDYLSRAKEVGIQLT